MRARFCGPAQGTRSSDNVGSFGRLRYFLVRAAIAWQRRSWPCFCCLLAKPPGKERRVLSLGFTTSSGPIKAVLSFKGWLTDADGYLGEERYTSINERCLIARVDKVAFDQCVDEWRRAVGAIVCRPGLRLLATRLSWFGQFIEGLSSLCSRCQRSLSCDRYAAGSGSVLSSKSGQYQ